MFVNITEKPPWGSVIKAITYYYYLTLNMSALESLYSSQITYQLC